MTMAVRPGTMKSALRSPVEPVAVLDRDEGGTPGAFLEAALGPVRHGAQRIADDDAAMLASTP
jgi:hypothetical protein